MNKNYLMKRKKLTMIEFGEVQLIEINHICSRFSEGMPENHDYCCLCNRKLNKEHSKEKTIGKEIRKTERRNYSKKL